MMAQYASLFLDPSVFRQRGKNMTLKKKMSYTTMANRYKEGKTVHLFSINDEVVYVGRWPITGVTTVGEDQFLSN